MDWTDAVAAGAAGAVVAAVTNTFAAYVRARRAFKAYCNFVAAMDEAEAKADGGGRERVDAQAAAREDA